MKPKCLDLFCSAGGCSRGYQDAGFEVVGVDIKHQPRFIGERFIQADALEYLSEIIKSGEVEEYDLISASPPCQLYSVTFSMSSGNHPDLVGPTRDLLIVSGRPYVIENVPGAPLINPLMLCGTMFNLRVIRHRLFECSPPIWFPPMACNHWGKATGAGSKRLGIKGTVSLARGFAFVTVCGNDYLADEGRMAMGIDWMTRAELSQAIPPKYCEWIGRQMLEMIGESTK